jgi:fructokinase
MQEICIVGLGETLVDIPLAGEPTVGGAPFNVAYHAHQLLQFAGVGAGRVVGAIADDHWGELILTSCREVGLDAGHLQVRPGDRTGTAKVLVSNGEAGFEITQDVAWDRIQADEKTSSLATRCSAVAFGSLAQRSPMSRQTIQEFVAKVHGIKLFDVNLRRNSGAGLPGYTAEIIAKSCALANIVKANEHEWPELATLLGFELHSCDNEERLREFSHRLLSDFALQGVVITRGAQGARFFGAEESIQLSDAPSKAHPIHPVGAGDAFSAGFLFGLVTGRRIGQALTLAERLAALVVQHPSATPRLRPELLREIV